MFVKLVTVAMLALSLLATAGSAQTAAELLQKGIYAQQTAGDPDGAIKIYQQVIGMAGADRTLAGRAQMQLVSAFLQKGDTAGAAREFNTLALSYGDQKEVVAAMTAAMRLAASTTSAQGSPLQARRTTAPQGLTKGTLENGVYHNATTGTEIRLPAGWSIGMDGISLGGSEYVVVKDRSNQSYYVWMISSSLSDDKLQQRTVDGVQAPQTLPMVVRFADGTQKGCSIAFAFDRNGAPIEYDEFVRTERTLVYFRSICPASSPAMVQEGIQMLVQATVLP
jgi:hypothetical protein